MHLFLYQTLRKQRYDKQENKNHLLFYSFVFIIVLKMHILKKQGHIVHNFELFYPLNITLCILFQ